MTKPEILLVTIPPVQMITGHPDTLAVLTANIDKAVRERWPEAAQVGDLSGFPLVPDESFSPGVVHMRPFPPVPDIDPLDTAVHNASLELTRALRYRLTRWVREMYPQAVTVRTSYNEYANQHVVWQVCGPHGKVLFSQESDGELTRAESRWRAEDDVDLLIRVAPAKGWQFVQPLTDPHMWSITLTRPAAKE